jgi:hypothetical protein
VAPPSPRPRGRLLPLDELVRRTERAHGSSERPSDLAEWNKNWVRGASLLVDAPSRWGVVAKLGMRLDASVEEKS